MTVDLAMMGKALLVDGDRVVIMSNHADASAIIVPSMSRDGRCCCTKPASRAGSFCRWEFRRVPDEHGPNGEAVFRIRPRAAAVKLTRPWQVIDGAPEQRTSSAARDSYRRARRNRRMARYLVRLMIDRVALNIIRDLLAFQAVRFALACRTCAICGGEGRPRYVISLDEREVGCDRCTAWAGDVCRARARRTIETGRYPERRTEP